MFSNQILAIKDITIFTGDDFIETGTVLIKNGQIIKVLSSTDDTSLDDGIAIVSRPGHTLIPGLIDAHVHGLEGNVQCLEQSLRFGVTTVCDMHNDPHSLDKLNGLARDPDKKHMYADFKCAGAGATIEGGWPAAVLKLEYKDKPEIASKIVASLPKLKDVTDAEPFVNTQITQHGASYIKLMHELGDTVDMALPRPPPALTRAIIDAAHARGLITIGHAFSYAGAMDLLRGGADGLTHVFFDLPPPSDGNEKWIAFMKKNGAHCNPTLGLAASQAGQGDELQRRFTQTQLSQRMLADKTPRQNLGLSAQNEKASFENVVRNTKAMYEAGIPLIVGSDCAGKHLGTAYGLGVHVEIHLLRHMIGMTTLEVLKSATSLTCDRFGFGDRGRIQAGKKADLVLLEGDPRQFMSDENELCLPIKAVWRDGVLCDAFKSQQ